MNTFNEYFLMNTFNEYLLKVFKSLLNTLIINKMLKKD